MQLTWHKQARSGVALRWLIFLCLVLVAVTTTAQVLHFHADQLDGVPKHCSICQVLHSVTPVAHSVQLDFSLHTTAFLATSAESHRYLLENSFSLFSRPPPLA